MDQNGYPDLLVGAYDDAAVALLRSRNIINITTYIRYVNKNGSYQEKIETIDPGKKGCMADQLSNYTWLVISSVHKISILFFKF